MKLKNIVSEGFVEPDLKGDTKDAVLHELLELLSKSGKVSDINLALADVMDREHKMSTGLYHGLAIPHAKTPAVKELVACIGIHRSGVDFQALGGELSRIFIMALSPVDRVGPHVLFVAEIGMLIRSAEAREHLVSAKTAQEVLAVFDL